MRGKRRGRTRRDQPPRGLGIKRADSQPLQTGRVKGALAVSHSEEERHGVGLKAPRGKNECLRRGRIEPLRVVDDHQQRAHLGRVRQQAQCARRHREATPAHRRTQRKRGPQCRSLWRWDLLQRREDRTAGLQQARKGHVRLCLHPDHRKHLHLARPGDGVAKQTALPDTCVSVQHERFAATFARPLE